MTYSLRIAFYALFLLLLTGCGAQSTILHGVDEREANIIVVLLESKGIIASKTQTASVAGPASSGPPTFDIAVPPMQAIEAMSFLNRNGFPKRHGQSLLDIFKNTGLMSSDKEETVRYQSGLAQQIGNMLQMIDGIVDVSVQLSFPPAEVTPGTTQTQPVTAAVFIKHQGNLDDPNLQIESKVKRLVSSSVSGLDINNVTVVTDRARLSDIQVESSSQMIGEGTQDYVKIWSMVISRSSLPLFRTLFFLILLLSILFMAAAGWLLWKIYPVLRKKGWHALLKGAPLFASGMDEPEGEHDRAALP